MPEIADDGTPELDIAESLRIGSAVLAARKSKSWSIKALADTSGLSTGMISQIERGRSLPSLKSLMMLAAALDVQIGHFFNAPEAPPHRGSSIYVVHRNERPTLKLTPTGVTKQHLSPDVPGMIEMFEVKLAAGGSSGPEFYRHEGEKAGMVLSGRLELWINDEPTLLEAGDSFRFPSSLPSRFNNPGSDETHLIWVLINTDKTQLHL
ncbi:hypothetical protein AWN88_00330 [Agrobacterium tumefaciens]|nr:hypothetical protein AWN88_00330 [Agrobacterium tumefaciens]KAJ32555.1 transcriptional regulator [Agrobacterium tumefaciens]